MFASCLMLWGPCQLTGGGSQKATQQVTLRLGRAIGTREEVVQLLGINLGGRQNLSFESSHQ